MNNTIYTADALGNVFLSTNGGGLWTYATSPESTILTGLSVLGTTIYLSTITGHVYISTNNGLSWTATQPTDNSLFSIQVTSDGTIYAAQDNTNTVIFSKNNGHSWIATTPPTGIEGTGLFVRECIRACSNLPIMDSTVSEEVNFQLWVFNSSSNNGGSLSQDINIIVR